MKFTFVLHKKFCVYVDWTTELTPRPYYVGKGTQSRVNHPIRNVVHNRISEKYGLNRVIVYETDDPVEALQQEVKLIAEYRTHIRGEGNWGANLTPGGEGKRGGSPMPSHSVTMKRLWQDPVYRQNVLTARIDSYTVSEKHKTHLSITARERWQDPNFRAHMSHPRTCKKCGQEGHMAKTCDRPEARRGALSDWQRKR